MAQTVALPVEEDARAPAHYSPWGLALRRLLRKRIAVAALVVIALFYIAGLFAPVIAPYDYRVQDFERVSEGPSLAHPFGTDRLGRDQLSRVIWSARTTMIVTVATITAGSLVLGVGLGLLSGYVGGRVDTAIMRTGEVFASLPGLLLLILINATMRPRTDRAVGWLEDHLSTDAMRAAVEAHVGGVFVFVLLLGLLAVAGVVGLALWLAAPRGARPAAWLVPAYATGVIVFLLAAAQGIFATPGTEDYFVIFGALALFFWVGSARVVRSQVLALRETEYVLAARAMGAGTWRILASHLLPNVSPIIIVGVSASLGAIAGTEVALTFLGVGVKEPTPSFGALIFDAARSTQRIRDIDNHPHLLLIPAAVVGLLIYAFNFLGDALNDVLTPKAR